MSSPRNITLSLVRALSSCIILLLFHLDAVAEESSGTQSLITNDTAASTLWEWRLEDFTESEYRSGIKPLLLAFEEAGGRKVEPGKHRRVGLKVFTNSGPGLATSKELVRALVAELEFRGFNRKEIFIIDQSERELRRAGYLPPLSLRQNDFYGVPVLALDSGAFYHPDWFYESPLPSFPVGEKVNDDRRSLLPYPLIEDIDFWINLPVAVDTPGVGVSCSLANASIWNVHNHLRFVAEQNSTPVAVTEICAIPELRATWAFTLLSFEKFQFIGGPKFHSLYTESYKKLCLSANPVQTDYYVLREMNRNRRASRFEEIPLTSPLFKYGQALGLGDYSGNSVKTVRLR